MFLVRPVDGLVVRWGRLGCSQVRALAGRLSARGVLFCQLRPPIGRGWVVLFRIFGPFPELPGAVQIGYLPAGLAGEFTAALIEESTITAELSLCSLFPAVDLKTPFETLETCESSESRSDGPCLHRIPITTAFVVFRQ